MTVCQTRFDSNGQIETEPNFELQGRQFMYLDNIPAELKQLRQWVIWRPRDLGKRKNVKVPYTANDVWKFASVNEPDTWATFDEAVAACHANVGVGLGFVFTKEDPYVGVDIDDEAKVDPRNLENFRALRAALLAGDSYTELSPSRAGAHIIIKGKLGRRGYRPNGVNVELYGSGRFFTMTGEVINGHFQINDGQELIDGFMARFPDSGGDDDDPVFLGELESNGRRLDLTDEQVLATLWSMPGFQERWYGTNVQDWSVEHFQMVGDVDKVTGDPEQVKRIVQQSPFVLNTPAKAGITRLAKSRRILMDDLARVRGQDGGFRHSPQFVLEGKQIWERVEAAKAEQARIEREFNEQYALKLEEEEALLGGLSADASSLFNAFPQLEKRHLELQRPPGRLGEFVQANERATYYPYTKYAIPATVAALSGLLGRRYKVDGRGLALNFILSAPMSTGKTEHAEAWEDFMTKAEHAVPGSPKRIISGEAASIQGIFNTFMQSRSLAWFSEEAFAMLQTMTSGKTAAGDQLKNSFNKLFDASKKAKYFSLPDSNTSRRNGAEPIPNLNVSTYWTMTPTEFKKFSGSSQDGFVSRIVMVQENNTYGEMSDAKVSDLPDELHQILVGLVGQARELDEEYSMAANNPDRVQGIVNVDLTWCQGLFQTLRRIVDGVRRKAVAHELPEQYSIIGRIIPNILKLSGLMAVLDNPWHQSPQVHPEHMLWATGYLLQNVVALLSDMDQGIVGEKQNDEVMAVMRGFNELVKRKENRQGVKWNLLVRHTRERAPFVNRPGSHQQVTQLVKMLVEDGTLLAQEEEILGKRGPKAVLLTMGNG